MKRKQLTMRQKYFMLRILGSESDPRCVKFLFWVHQLDECDDIFAWILKMGYCGKELVPFLRSTFKDIDFNRDDIKAGKAVTAHFERFKKIDTFKLFPVTAN
jgi:hypothetical protein